MGVFYRINHSDYLFPEFSISGEVILPTGKEMTQVSYSGQQTALIVDAAIDDRDTYLFEAGLHHHLGKGYYVAISYGQGVGASEVKSQQLIGMEKEF